MLIKRLHDYFGFNRQQRNGLIVLCSLSVLLLGVRLLYPLFLPDPQIQEVMLPFEPVARELKDGTLPVSKMYVGTPIDPNTAPIEAFEERGLNHRSARALIRFRGKGFVFRKAEDLQRIYGVSAEEYQRLSPLLRFPASSKNKKALQIAAGKQIKKLEVNSADSIAWCELPGIGPSFAKRILKYRNLLGGFARLDQLKEVYGLDEERFQKIQPFLLINTDSIRKINVNTAEFKTMVRHPYIGYELTKEICNKRRKLPFTAQNLCELGFSEANCVRLQAYLTFGP